MAVRFDFLSPTDLSRALEAWRADGGKRSFGDVLVDRGFLEEADLEMLSQVLQAGLEEGTGEEEEGSRPQPGMKLGDFRVVRRIGRGSMGVVYEAIQEGLDRPVALKVLPSDITRDERTIERFLREAGAAASLNHTGVVKVLSVGEEGGYHYYAMEMVDGESLDRLVEREALPFRRAAEIIRDAADALDYAHREGVTHRDIKPGNIMVTRDGRVLIGDFGLAQIEAAATLTRSDEIVGTPIYMSPEQARGDREGVGPPTDIYSLGATLYEALTRTPPFEGTDIHSILSQVIATDPAPLRSRRPPIPRDLETICFKAMEKDRRRRYPSARAMADDLTRFLRGDPIHARPPTWTSRAFRKMRRNKPAAMMILLAVVAALSAAAFLVGKRIRDDSIVRDALQAGERHLEAGREAFRRKMRLWKEVEAIEASLGRNQKSARKSEKLAAIAKEQEREREAWDRALAAFRRACEFEPDHAGARGGIAEIFLGRAKTAFQEARRQWEPDFHKVEERVAQVRLHAPGGRFERDLEAMLSYIRMTGSIDVLSRPPGARVRMVRVRRGGDDPEKPAVGLGRTPIEDRVLEPGTWRLTLSRKGYRKAVLPVFISRDHPHPALDPVELFREEETPSGLAYIPGGEFLFGGRVEVAAPVQWRRLPPFFLGVQEVTFEEYLRFINESGGGWTLEPFLPDAYGLAYKFDPFENRFVAGPGWEDVKDRAVWGIPLEGAKDYCEWRTALSLERARRKGARRYLFYHLPSEAQWEKGARGTDGRLFPWGDTFDEKRCNNQQGWKASGSEGGVAPPGRYPGGASPYGLMDMAGNVAEWTSTFDETGWEVVVKGGDVNNRWLFLSSPARRTESPKSRRMIGFRMAATFKPVPE